MALLPTTQSAIKLPVCKLLAETEYHQLIVYVDPLTRARALIHAFTTAEKLNNTGSTSPGVPRLGLPAYTWWQEALHGVADSPGVNFSDPGTDFSVATSFPQPILMGAAFDDALIREVATVVSTEARAFNNDGRAGLDFWSKSASVDVEVLACKSSPPLKKTSYTLLLTSLKLPTSILSGTRDGGGGRKRLAKTHTISAATSTA